MDSSIRVLAALLSAVAVITSPTVAHAQGPVRLGLGLGVSMPVGDISATAAAGVNFQASLTYEPPRFPIGFDVSGTYHNFAPLNKTGRNSHILAVTGGITLPIGGTLGEPYLMAGVGYYNTQGPTTGPVDAERDIGGYGGAGIRFTTEKFQFHVRASFHEIMAGKDIMGRTRSREMVPITFTIVL